MGKRGPGAKPVKARVAADKEAQLAPPSCLTEGATRADRVMAFLGSLTITSGAYAGQKLALRPWQRRVITEIYATDDDGLRHVRLALISLGRKSGKSTLTAGLALCHLVGPEAVPRGQVIAAAGDRNQAGLIYNEIQAFADADPEIGGRLIFRTWNKSIEDTVTGSTFNAASSDVRKLHGTSPVFFVADEVGQWKNAELLDALRTGQGAHREPLGVIISTRSPDPTSPLETLIHYGEQVRAGIVVDDSFASFVWSAPTEADPWAPATWAMANPDADPVRMADIAIQARSAQRLPSQQAPFFAYCLNRPTVLDERFVGPDDWRACADDAPAEGPVFGALDLASGASDLTAASLFWPDSGRLRVWGFIPESKLAEKEASDHAPYRQWVTEGLIVPIPGPAIDRVWLAQWLAETVDGLDLQGLACDRWGLNDWLAVLGREGIDLPMEPFGQGFRDMSPAVSEFERLVLSQGLHHGDNALLKWALSNAVVDHDPAGGRKLAKNRSRGRIDPLVACVMACGLAAKRAAPLDFSFTGVML